MSSLFDFDSSWIDVPISVVRAKGVEVTIAAIPLLDEVEELGLKGADRRRVELLTFREIEVKRNLELERFLIHQISVYRNLK